MVLRNFGLYAAKRVGFYDLVLVWRSIFGCVLLLVRSSVLRLENRLWWSGFVYAAPVVCSYCRLALRCSIGLAVLLVVPGSSLAAVRPRVFRFVVLLRFVL